MILANCRLIPELCDGIADVMADIRVEKKITEILPAGGNYVGEEVVDCTGMTVVPGLFNCHEHLFWEKNSFATLHTYSDFDHAMHSLNYANMLLAHGFTTVKDCGSINNTAIKLRDAINAGLVVGPNVLACGPSMSPNYGNEKLLDIYSPFEGNPINSIEDIYPAVRRQLSRGADFIKICTTTAKDKIKAPQDAVGRVLYTPEEIMEWTKCAAREGTTITAHSTCVESHEAVIAAECHTLDHGLYLAKENVDQLVAHGFKTALVPTLAASYTGWRDAWPTYDVCHPRAGEGMKMAHDAGVLVGFGTDNFQEYFAKMPSMEWVARTDFGLTVVDVLKQATINSAKICGVAKSKGTIKVGATADLAIFHGNPDEDVTLFDQPCAYVLKNGAIVAREGVVQTPGMKKKKKKK